MEARTNPTSDLKTGGKVVQVSGWLRFWGKRREGDLRAHRKNGAHRRLRRSK